MIPTAASTRRASGQARAWSAAPHPALGKKTHESQGSQTRPGTHQIVPKAIFLRSATENTSLLCNGVHPRNRRLSVRRRAPTRHCVMVRDAGNSGRHCAQARSEIGPTVLGEHAAALPRSATMCRAASVCGREHVNISTSPRIALLYVFARILKRRTCHDTGWLSERNTCRRTP